MPDLKSSSAASKCENLALPANLPGHVSSSQQPLQPHDAATVATSTSAPEPCSSSALAMTPASSFRNVSACNRCRLRKHRCDQRLPRCQSCEKAQLRCVGYDPITKQEIPRSYVYFLENRLKYLNKVLSRHKIDCKPVVAFDEEEANAEVEIFGPTANLHHVATALVTDRPRWELSTKRSNSTNGERGTMRRDISHGRGTESPQLKQFPDGIFWDLLSGKAARLEIMRLDKEHDRTDGDGTSIRTSLFGLRTTRSTKAYAGLPSRERAECLVELYFKYLNPNMPALHQEDLREVLIHIYSVREEDRSARNSYFLFIVFAIGATFRHDRASSTTECEPHQTWCETRPSKRQKLSSIDLSTPEHYHATAMAHLERSLNSSSPSDRLSELEELQAMILFASFALVRPTTPGLGRLVDVAMHLAIDLRLYCEHRTGPLSGDSKQDQFSRHGAHQDCTKDLRRRLWWCVYSLDRLVAPYVGRPFFIQDEVVTSEFPSILGDKYTTHHCLRLRILQSEIHSVLQCQQALVTINGKSLSQSRKPRSFLSEFSSFNSWRTKINQRLDEWKNSIPTQEKTGSQYSILSMELEYWQTIIMLYRWSVTIPTGLIGCSSPANNIIQQLPIEAPEDPDIVYLKVAEAGQRVLQIYRLLQNIGFANVTYLTVHGIFTAGTMFLFALWNSSCVRHKWTVQDLDYSILAVTSVLDDLAGKYALARASRDALERMGVATVKMCLTVTNFEHSARQSGVATLGRTYQDHFESEDATGQALLRRELFKGSQRWHKPESDRNPDPQNPRVVYWTHRYSSEDVSKSRESDKSIQNGIQESLPLVSIRCQDDPCDIKPWIEWPEDNDFQGPSCLMSPGLSTKSYEKSRAFGSDYSQSDFDLFGLAFGTTKSTSSVSEHIADCISEASSHNAKEGLEDTWDEIDQNTLEAYLVGWPDTSSPTNQ